jgi:hypothetical protein
MVQFYRRLVITGLLSSAAMAMIRPRTYNFYELCCCCCRLMLKKAGKNPQKEAKMRATNAAELPEKTLSSENLLNMAFLRFLLMILWVFSFMNQAFFSDIKKSALKLNHINYNNHAVTHPSLCCYGVFLILHSFRFN